MKMTFRGLTLAAAMLTASGTAYADQNQRVGDLPDTPIAYVGDISAASEAAYFADDAKMAEAAVQAAHANDATAVSDGSVVPQPQPMPKQQPMPMPKRMTRQSSPYAPVSVNKLKPHRSVHQPVGYFTGSTGPACGCDDVCNLPNCDCGSDVVICDGGCSTASCDGGCDSGCRRGGCSMRSLDLGKMLGLCSSDGWARSEALLWFVENRQMPALVTTAPAGGLPILGFPGTQTVFGDEADGGLSVGYRSDFGRYIDDNLGIGVRFWTLAENSDEYSAAGDGTNFSIGRPYYNNVTNIEDAVLVAFDPTVEGSVHAESAINLEAAEAYARMKFTCSKSCQLDFLGGYSYFRVDDTLRISNTSIDSTSARSFNDLFAAKNRFNGGQLGFEAVIKRGRWFARSLTKVHLGDMDQTVRIDGSSSQDFLNPGPVFDTDGGLLALGNQGEYHRNVFTFIPEMNFKLGYKFRQHVEMSVGYTFMYFDNVALAGAQVDPTLNPAVLNTGGPFGNRPAFTFNDSSLWVQGIDLGLGISY